MTRAVFAFIGIAIFAAACTQRAICPAYQSAFIYDKDELRKKFSYFVDDSTPKVYAASKNKYLIAEAMPYQKKLRTMRTVRMKPVMVQVPDSILTGKADSVNMDEMRRATQSVIDSTFIADIPQQDSVTANPEDSVYVITKDREIRVLKYNMPDSLFYDSATGNYVRQKPQYYVEEVGYNVDQDNYMWYLRRSLVLPDVRLAKLQQDAEGGASISEDGGERRGLRGFFKSIFRKKPVDDIDSAEFEVPADQKEFDFIDTTAVEEQIIEEPQPKKGFLNKKNKDGQPDQNDPANSGRNKKKRKKSDKNAVEENPAEKKEAEDEDDGF
ncbi:MAG TPA: hypothetical protein VD927_18570 [Chryseosolibacter sp.]|nr:hypothetical protein [Chryseosolibacter sp.]